MAVGLLFGGMVSLLRPWAAAGIALAAVICFLILALEAARGHVWFPWTVSAFAQIPWALAWSLRGHFHRLKFEKEVVERTLTETTRWAEAG